MTPFTLLAQEAAAGKLSADLLHNLGRLAPELLLCGAALLVLVVDLVRGRGPSVLFPRLALVGILAAMVLVFLDLGRPPAGVGYGGFRAITVDDLAGIFKLVFLAAGALTVLFIARSNEEYGREPELAILLLGALAGMCYLAGASDLLSFYLAFETVSYTGYLMAGYRTDNLKVAEAGGKYVIFGSVSSAVMLFGLSLLYGWTGSTELGAMAAALEQAGREPVLLVAAVLVFGGFAFKAAAFPFQFWCPDVYEGAPAPIAGFLAVASKAAVFAVGLRVLASTAAIDAARPFVDQLFAGDGTFVQKILIVSAVGTMTWGNLAALRQSSLQRMLAYSSIAHAGYLLMAAAVVLRGTAVGSDAVGAIVFYFLVYLCMNLGAFFVVTIMRRDAGSADISALRGAGFRHPFLAVCFAVMLFSLTGLPPTAGFVGKFQLFAPVLREGFYLLAGIGLINGAISLYYYAKPLKEMFLTEPVEGEAPRLAPAAADLAMVGLLTAPLLVLGVFGWDAVTGFARSVAMVN